MIDRKLFPTERYDKLESDLSKNPLALYPTNDMEKEYAQIKRLVSPVKKASSLYPAATLLNKREKKILSQATSVLEKLSSTLETQYRKKLRSSAKIQRFVSQRTRWLHEAFGEISLLDQLKVILLISGKFPIYIMFVENIKEEFDMVLREELCRHVDKKEDAKRLVAYIADIFSTGESLKIQFIVKDAERKLEEIEKNEREF